MENKATTKTPIPTRSGFRNFALCTLIFAFSISRPSTLVEPPLQIALFFAKRTQFSQRQNQCNSLCRKGLPKKTTPGHSKKTNPIEPKRTQCQNRQNEDKLRNSKGLCKSTTNNEQRALFKTNPILPHFQRPWGAGVTRAKKNIFFSKSRSYHDRIAADFLYTCASIVD